MKNSLFKRVFATVASVPFALSQCLTYTSYAVTNDSVQVETANARAGGGEVYNLEKLLYIEPGQTESTWYDTFHTELVAIGESGNNVRTISKEMLEDIILKNVGKHAGQAEEVIKMLADEGITYRISSSGDITIIAEIVRNPDFSIFTAEANARIEQALNEMKQKVEDAKAEMSEKFDIPIEEFDDFNVSKEYLAEKYGVPLEELEKYNFTKEDIAEKLDIPVEDLEDVNSVEDIEIPAFDFSEVDFTGKFELIIKGSDLEDGHTMGIQAKYTSNQPVNGKRVWSMGDLVEFADVKLEELKVCADRTIHEIPDEEAKAEAKSMVTNKFSGLEKWIDKAYNNKDKLTDRKHNITKTAGNVQQLIQQINDYIDEARATGKYSHLVERVERRLGKNANIPPTASAIFAIDPVLRIYDTIMNDLDEIAVSYNIDLPSSAIAEFADTDLRNVTATAKGDTYTLAGFFHDEELGGDNLKEMLATIELGDINTPDATLATIGLQIFRPEQTTTTTTTSTTTTSGTDSTTTTTASNGTDTTTTTTETSGTDTDTTTTTTDTTDGTDTDTTTTTETSDYTGTDTDTTTTTTDSDYTGTDTDTTTTTTDSDYTGTDTDTTTTTTDSDYTGTDTDTTTTTTDSDYTGTDTDTTTTTTDTTDGTGTDTDTTTTTDTTDGTGTDTTTTDTTDDGSSTSTETTTTPFEGAVLPGVVRRIFATVTASDEGDYGFYYSYETEFHKEQVKEVVMQIVYTDGTEGTLPITYDFASTPAETFEKYDVDFKYTAALVYNGGDVTDQSGKVVLKNGDILKTSEDEDAGVVAYIGYRGDVNLDYAVNAVDASQTQAYYAELSTGKQTDETVLSESKLVESASSIYDDFAAFLGDVNMSNQKDEIVEWRTGKKGRALDAIDATGILTAYAELSTNTTYAIGDKALWDAVLA